MFQNSANWTEDIRDTVNAHFNYLKSLNEKGTVIFAGKTDYNVDNNSNCGIVVFEVNDETQAEELMRNDPAVKGKVMTAELHPFRVALLPIQ